MSFEETLITAADDPGPLKLAVYGEWGCGKSVLAAGAPRPLLLDCENSRRSLLNHGDLALIPVRVIKKYKDMENVVFSIIDKDPFFETIDTIIVDTWDRLQQLELREEVQDAHKKNSSRHPYLPSQNEYNINNKKLEALLIRLIEESNKNLIILCHDKEERDNEGQTVIIRPGTSPAMTNTVAALVDAVFYMTYKADSKGEITRKLRLLPTRKIRAKNRLGNLPAELDNPNIMTIFDAAEEQRKIALGLRGKD